MQFFPVTNSPLIGRYIAEKVKNVIASMTANKHFTKALFITTSLKSVKKIQRNKFWSESPKNRWFGHLKSLECESIRAYAFWSLTILLPDNKRELEKVIYRHISTLNELQGGLLEQQ